MSSPWGDIAETHSAIVVFVGDRAYKLKKPVRFDFLDFSTREKRERAVHREVELNLRLAPDVYLGVSDVMGVDGRVCDHLVVMRRMPSERRLAALVQSGRATEDDVRAIARVVAAFHSRAETSPEIAAVGLPANIADKLARDLTDLNAFRGNPLDPALLDEAGALARQYLAGRARLLDARVAGGWILDGHGDLLADDVFCLADGPRILDCIDFDDQLRFGDVLADVAFLAMDLERLGAPELADQFLRSYAEFSGEHHPASLADYYVAFRALIRAKVACLRGEQGDETGRATAQHLLDLAVAHLRRARVTLVLVGGAPGTGKSTLARALGDAKEWSVLRSDVIRKQVAGFAPEQSLPAAFREGIYSEADTARTYEELLARARVMLELGESVILDASWIDASPRDAAAEIARVTSSELIELRCDLAPDVAADRIERRRAHGSDASDADTAIAAALRAQADPWPTATVIATAGSPAESLSVALTALENGSPGSVRERPPIVANDVGDELDT